MRAYILLACLLVIGSLFAADWTLDGDRVYWSANGYTISAAPAHARGINVVQYANFTSSNPTPFIGNFSFVFSPAILSGSADIWTNTNHPYTTPIIGRIDKSVVIDVVSYAATNSTNCYIGDLQNLLRYNITYTIGNNTTSNIGCFNNYTNVGSIYTLHYQENATIGQQSHDNYYMDWKDISSQFTTTMINDHQVFTINNVQFTQGTNYQVRFKYMVQIGTSGKYDIYVHGGSPAQVVAGTAPIYLQLDPWYNASYGAKVLVNVTNFNCRAAFCQFPINITLNSTKTNGTDMVIVKATEDGTWSYWRETNGWNYTTASGRIWVNASNNTASFYVYYNSTGADNSNGDNTFLFFDDFNGVILNNSKWVAGGCLGANTQSFINSIWSVNSTACNEWKGNISYDRVGTNTSVVFRAVNISTGSSWGIGVLNAGVGTEQVVAENPSTAKYYWRSDAHGGTIEPARTENSVFRVVRQFRNETGASLNLTGYTDNLAIPDATETTKVSTAKLDQAVYVYSGAKIQMDWYFVANYFGNIGTTIGAEQTPATAPTINTMNLTNSTGGTAFYKNRTILAWANITDGNAFNATWRWLRNGTEMANGSITSFANNTFYNFANLSAGNTTTAGYVWILELSAIGTGGNATQNSTNNATITNRLPFIATNMTFADASAGHWFKANSTAGDDDGAGDITFYNLTITSGGGTCSKLSNSTSGIYYTAQYNCTTTAPANPTIKMLYRDSSGASIETNSVANPFPDVSPTLGAPSITPSSPTYQNNLTCNAGVYSDIDGDTENVSARIWRWYLNGSIIAGANSATLNNSSFAVGDSVLCMENATNSTWTPIASANSSAVVILAVSTIYTMNAVSLSQSPIIFNTSVNCLANSTFANTSATLNFEWYVNYILVKSGTYYMNLSQVNTSVNIDTLAAAYMDFGDLVLCQARIWNGSGYSAFKASGISSVQEISNSLNIYPLPAMILLFWESWQMYLVGLFAVGLSWIVWGLLDRTLFSAALLCWVGWLALGEFGLFYFGILYFVMGLVARFSIGK